MGKLYGLSERDHDRAQAAIRKIESLNISPLFRRFPVFSGGGVGWPVPKGLINIYSTTPNQLTKATHERQWLHFCNDGDPPYPPTTGADKAPILPPNPSINDFYFLVVMNHGAYHVHLHPSPGQTIILPSETYPVNSNQYIDLDNGTVSVVYQSVNVLILACNAPNQWIAVDAGKCVVV